MRCLELAKKGFPAAIPNPLVGCVIVYKDKIIGEGFHSSFGAPHAEVNAILNVKDKKLLKHSTLYVNLEPCAHHGKTPPCADLIIEHGIPKVFISNIDPNPVVAGNGIKKLEESRIEVNVGLLNVEAKGLNSRFFTFHEEKRPYIILKWAQTKDGFIADSNNNSKWISNEYSRMLVHKWRSEEQAIMVGTQTARIDNPRLNVRDWDGQDPLRIVLDKELVLSEKLNLFDNTVKTIVFNSKIDKVENITYYIKIDYSSNIVPQVLDHLYSIGIQSVIVEGGSYLINSFIELNIWDEARVFTGTKKFNNGISTPILKAAHTNREEIKEDILEYYYNN